MGRVSVQLTRQILQVWDCDSHPLCTMVWSTYMLYTLFGFFHFVGIVVMHRKFINGNIYLGHSGDLRAEMADII